MLKLQLICLTILSGLTVAHASDHLPSYPATRADAIKDVLHGVEVRDPYRWLENVKTAEVKEWMKSQDALARSELKQLPGRDAIAERLRKLYYVDDLGVPEHHGRRYFY